MPESIDCKTFRPYRPTPAFACVLPLHWPIARRARRRPELWRVPTAVVATVGRNAVVVDASPAAAKRGVRVGLSLAENRAICPDVVPIDHDADGDHRALAALGRWMTRFTPSVATGWTPEPGEPPAPPLLLLDVTGCARLFGSIEMIERGIATAMKRFGLPARIAIGETPGAAYALTFGAGRDALPIESLRLPIETVARLRRLGLDTIGQVLALPRDSLPARFGPSLGKRIDQLLGTQAEPLVPLEYDVPVETAMAFDGPVDALETLWRLIDELVDRVATDLTRRGRGARRIELTCAPDPASGWPPVTRVVNLAAPSRDRTAIVRLLRCATERLECGEGFTRIRLRVPLHERVGDEQGELLDAEARLDRAAWGKLIERLSVRLGADRVVRPIAMESHLPERAWHGVPATSVAQECRVPHLGTPMCGSRSNVVALSDAYHTSEYRGVAPGANGPRPLTLLPTPAEVRVVAEPSDDWEGRPAQFTHGGRVHRVVDVVGPERISGEWWRGHHKTRDYYDVRDEQGRRFWLFRVVAPIAGASLDGAIRLSTRWFLHGVFAAALLLSPSPPYPGERAGVRG